MQHRAVVKLDIKAASDDARIIEGIASTPAPDRQGDVVEPQGVEYKLPLPFLLDHDHSRAVGEVEHVDVTPQGIRFRARIPKIAEPGRAKDLCDEAWSLIRNGLRRAVSIGFRPLDSEPVAGGGQRFKRWEWVELSAVSVPAQAEAVITATKGLIVHRTASASGRRRSSLTFAERRQMDELAAEFRRRGWE